MTATWPERSDQARAGDREVLLEIDGVTMAYGDPSAGPVLEDVNLSVGSGERCMLLGPSGCGKSTLLRAVGGFHAPARGEIRVGGDVVRKPGPDRAFVFQEFDQLFPWKRVLANVAYPLMVNGGKKPQAREKALVYLEMMGLQDAVGKYPHELSGGMKQRVAIARAMALEPRVLLMDEPFGALDAQTRGRLQEQFRTVTTELGTTVIFVTHSIHEAAFLGDSVVVLGGGRPGQVVGHISCEHTPAGDLPALETRLESMLASAHTTKEHG